MVAVLLARGMDEAGELSLRLALGASRARILRLLVLEVAALATICAGLGCLGARVLLARAGAYLPVPPVIDGGVLAFTIVLVIGVVCVAGVFPAWQTSRDIVAAGLREFHDQSRRRVRLRNALVVVQVAASVALLALGGLAIRSLTASAPAIAADARQILAADFDFAQVRPAAARSGLFVDSILADLSRAPAIGAAAFATFATGGAPMRYWRTSDPPQVERVAYGGFVSAGWFAATGTTFIGGSERAAFAPGAAVVNRALAATLETGGAGTAIGTRLRVQIIWLVTAPVVWLVSAGAAAGLATALVIAVLLRSVLLGAASLDVTSLLPSIAILLGVAAAAAFGPAFHAVHVDPVRSLREE